MYKPAIKLMGAAVLGIGLAGCAAVGPNYSRPALDVPASIGISGSSTPTPAAGVIAPVDVLTWWQSFQDPALNALMTEATANSQDLLLAAGRIAEARASADITNAERYPSVDLVANASRNRSSRNTNLLPQGVANYNRDFRVALSASYEIDFWGKFSRADEAARARLLAQQASRGVVLSTLYSNLAQNYFALRAYDAQAALADTALKTRQDNLRLQQKLFAAGSIGKLEMHQAEAEVAAAEISQAQARQQIGVTESTLALLAGRSPRAVAAPVIVRGTPVGALYAHLQPPADLPADLLNRRPDILAAEQALVAANADIGQARAAYFPSVRLTGSGGYESNMLRTLLDPASLLWNLAAGLTQPVFRAGAIGAVVAGAEARTTQARAQYVLAVQNAFKDVHDALTTMDASAQIVAASNRRQAALQDSLHLATLRYDNGYVSYLEVLTAQRDLLQTQASVIDVQRAHLAAAAGLYRAVGGGWDQTSVLAVQ